MYFITMSPEIGLKSSRMDSKGGIYLFAK